MGRIDINPADLPQSRRGTPFTDPEVARLVQEIRVRSDIIYGTKTQPVQLHKVRQAWEEIAAIISTVSDIERTADQCRKRFNDIKRRGQKMVVTKKRGRPPKGRSTLEPGEVPEASNNLEELDDFEYEMHDFEYEIPAHVDDDDPDYEPSPKKRDLKVVVPKEMPVEIPVVALTDLAKMPSHNPSLNPQVSSHPPAQSPSTPKPESPSPPNPQSPSLYHLQSPSPPKTPSPSLPKTQASSGPKPQMSSGPRPKMMPRPPGSSISRPQGPPKPRPQGPPNSTPQGPPKPRPQGPPRPRPQGPMNSRPQGPPNSSGKPAGAPLTKPKVVMVRKPVGSTDPNRPPSRPLPDDDKHPFLELQQSGFNMLKKELSGFRDSVMSLNTRLNHLELALRPVGHIADSLSRIANAVERLTCPPDDN